MKFDTVAVRGANDASEHNSSIQTPIYQTTAFHFEDVQYAADLFDLKCEGDIYSRISNPTVSILEKRLAAMEGGVGALCTASGQSASLIAILNIAKSGDEIVASSTLYGGTINLLSTSLKKVGIKTVFIDASNIEAVEKVINERTKAVFAETLGNPKLDIADIEALASVAHKYSIPLIIDNTVPSPYLCNPFEFGADIIVHSLTKYISGHGNAMGGAIVDSGKFDWAKSGKFTELTEPDPSYHGVSYTETFKNAAYIVKARTQLLRDFGACLSPFNAYLILLGVETLHLRMDRHCKSAMQVAQHLISHPDISWVNYPMLEDGQQYVNAKKYLKGGSSIVSFGIKGGQQKGIKFIEGLKLAIHATNIGDARTIITYPILTTHRQLNAEELKACGLGEDFMRISVGLEDVEDIIADIDQAIEIAKKS